MSIEALLEAWQLQNYPHCNLSFRINTREETTICKEALEYSTEMEHPKGNWSVSADSGKQVGETEAGKKKI